MTGLATISAPALAGAKLEIDETKWVSIGAGIRTHAKWTEDGAPSAALRRKRRQPTAAAEQQ